MRLSSWLGGLAAIALLASCSSPREEPSGRESEETAPIVVPAAFVGTWGGDGCERPSVRIGVAEIRHFYADAASPLTSVEASPEGRLVLTWMDEGKLTTDTFQMTDGKLDHISTVSASSNDQWQSEPMTKCSGSTALG
jgi:hypothetical protein